MWTLLDGCYLLYFSIFVPATGSLMWAHTTKSTLCDLYFNHLVTQPAVTWPRVFLSDQRVLIYFYHSIGCKIVRIDSCAEKLVKECLGCMTFQNRKLWKIATVSLEFWFNAPHYFCTFLPSQYSVVWLSTTIRDAVCSWHMLYISD